MIAILFQIHKFYEGSRKNIEKFFGKFFEKGLLVKMGGVPLFEMTIFFWNFFFGMGFIGKTPHPLCQIIKIFWKILCT